MTVRAQTQGHDIEYVPDREVWIYSTGDEAGEVVDFSDPAPCTQCGRHPRMCNECREPHDACLGHIPGVSAACCGHGRESGLIRWAE